MKNKTVIVIPMYNESKRFHVEHFLQFVDSNPYHYLLVNDGSTDNTQEMVENVCKKHWEKVTSLELKQNSGKAEAVRQGFLAAANNSAHYIGYWDADFATPLKEIPSLVETLDANAELLMVMGARVKLMGRDITRKMMRHYLGRVFASFASMTLNLGVYDTQCGAKLFKNTEASQALFNEKFISKWIFDVEIIARLNAREGCEKVAHRIFEYPLHSWNDVSGTKLNKTDFIWAVVELARIAIKYRSLRHPKLRGPL